MANDVRIYTVVVCALVVLIGTPQLRGWFREGDAKRRLHWLSSIALNLAILLGTAEALYVGAPGGIRVLLVAVAVTWLLAAVAYYPIVGLLARRHHSHHSSPRQEPPCSSA